jgi:hypothetical protein
MQRTRNCPSGHNKRRQVEAVSAPAPAAWRISACPQACGTTAVPDEGGWMT